MEREASLPRNRVDELAILLRFNRDEEVAKCNSYNIESWNEFTDVENNVQKVVEFENTV